MPILKVWQMPLKLWAKYKCHFQQLEKVVKFLSPEGCCTTIRAYNPSFQVKETKWHNHGDPSSGQQVGAQTAWALATWAIILCRLAIQGPLAMVK